MANAYFSAASGHCVSTADGGTSLAVISGTALRAVSVLVVRLTAS